MMKQLILIFLFFSLSTFSQNFKKVDAVVINYPRFSKVEDLANQIEKDFSSDADKSRAAFFWLAKNIRYNLREFYNPTKRNYSFSYKSEEEKTEKIKSHIDNIVSETFRNQTGVCEEYAQSFKKICDLLKIEAEVIKGNARTSSDEIGKISNTSNHAWNAVKIDKKWIILDATWAAGYENNGKWIRSFNDYFYDIPVNKIFKTHYPEDTIWNIRFGRMSVQEFYNQPIYSNTFLTLNTDLISPTSGIINLKASEDIVLKFKNLDKNLLVFYTLKGMKNPLKPIITSEKNTTTLTIKNPKINTDLVLFINKEDALHFRISMQ
ncbi:Transglutaminase-like superfamily protein [Polaribacter sp. KT25b]|nr:Transglutaminase-like superfamily protein [Polaribacter sp. KT25b]